MDEDLNKKEVKMQLGQLSVRTVLQKEMLYSDGTADYRIPPEPGKNEKVRVRFRTGTGNADMVFLCHRNERINMNISERIRDFDFYETELQLGEEAYHYYFEVYSVSGHCYYDRSGVCEELRPEYDFCIVPGFSTPDWAKGAVIYQIFTDRFCNGEPSNDVESGEYFYINRQTKKIDNWDKYPDEFDVADFYGGDLRGVMSKFDYLQDLGVEILYFNPLFVSASSHKYDTQDYDYIDPHFGVIIENGGNLLPKKSMDNRKADKYIRRVTSKINLEASNRLFAEFVEEAHSRGMKVILDGVFNHCGSFHKWLDREGIYQDRPGFPQGAYADKHSPYHSYFNFLDEKAFPNNTSYEGWWGHNTLPKLNYEGSEKLEEYILRIAKKWISPPYNADGWRLDVAADLGHTKAYNHAFWRKFRKAVKETNPDAIIVAEHYGDPKEWLDGQQWDTVMNYDGFMDPVSWFMTGMEKHSEEYRESMAGNVERFRSTMDHHMARFLTPSLLCAMNQLSNHDHSRFLTRTNHKVGRAVNLGRLAASENVNKGILRAAVVIQMTMPGAPAIYYGDEAGMCGFTDPDNRRTYPWGDEDRELIAFHRDIIRIHKENQAFRTGSVKYLHGENNILSYGRFNRSQQFIIIINNDRYSRPVSIDVCPAQLPQNCILKQIMFTYETGYSCMPVEYDVMAGVLKITLPRNSAVILSHEENP